jgi:hypothetical protein
MNDNTKQTTTQIPLCKADIDYIFGTAMLRKQADDTQTSKKVKEAKRSAYILADHPAQAAALHLPAEMYLGYFWDDAKNIPMALHTFIDVSDAIPAGCVELSDAYKETKGSVSMNCFRNSLVTHNVPIFEKFVLLPNDTEHHNLAFEFLAFGFEGFYTEAQTGGSCLYLDYFAPLQPVAATEGERAVFTAPKGMHFHAIQFVDKEDLEDFMQLTAWSELSPLVGEAE